MTHEPGPHDHILKGRAPRAPRSGRRSTRQRRFTAVLILGAAFIIPMLLVLLIFGQAGRRRPIPTPPFVQFVTATAPPAVELPAAFLQSLSATPPPEFLAPTATPGTAGSPFVTATPAFSLATSTIAYVCYINGYDQICLMNGEGGDQQQITETRTTDFYPSLSPDGRSLLFSSLRNGREFDIYLMDLESRNLLRLTYDMGDNYAPELSPDGTRIVFASTGGEGGDQNIWVMNADGSSPTRLTFDPADDIDPTWSPDGRQIAFASNRNGTTELFVMNADGSNVRQLTFGVNIGGRSDWSPDGRFLTFYAGPKGDKNVYIMSAECAFAAAPSDCAAEPYPLTDGGNNKGPSFSPDGEWITFAANRGSDNEIYIIRIDGSDLRQLTFNTWADWQPRWGP